MKDNIKIQANLTAEKKGMLRRNFHNPLFHAIHKQLNDIFLEDSNNETFIFERLYVENSTVPRLIEATMSKSDNTGLVYLLLGKKGQGKTRALRDYYHQIQKGSTKNIVLYFDLKNFKSNRQFIDNLHTQLLVLIFESIKNDPSIPTVVREHLTITDKIREIDPNYFNMNDSALHQRILDHKDEAIQYLFQWLKREFYNLCFVFDNVDDFPKTAIIRLVDKCRDLRDNYNVKCLVALREYWNPASLGIIDQHIPSLNLDVPNIFEITIKRLRELDVKKNTKTFRVHSGSKTFDIGQSQLISIFEDICRTFTDRKDLHDDLLKLSNDNVREYLKNIYYFFHSPYLFSKPNFNSALIQIIKKYDRFLNVGKIRNFKFHDFIECFMGIHYLCYDDESRLFNLYYHEYSYQDGISYKNTLIYSRIIQIANIDGSYFSIDIILNQLLEIGYNDINENKDAIQKLLNADLLESKDGVDISDIRELKLSTKGIFYIKNILTEYSYYVFISDAVPMPEQFQVDIIQKFGSEIIPIQRGQLWLKHQSVNKFLDFLKLNEDNEKDACQPDKYPLLERVRGNYLSNISTKIKQQIARMDATESNFTDRIERIETLENESINLGD